MLSRFLYWTFGPLVRKKVRHVSGLENLPAHTPVIIAANHEGYLDGPVLSYLQYKKYSLLTNYITYQFMWRILGGPFATHAFGMIPRRDNHKADVLVDVKKVLENKGIVGIFPESTRNTDKKTLLRGKTGAVRLALATGVPIVPVGLSNTTGHRIGRAFKSLWERKTHIDVVFGSPLDMSEFENQPIDKPLLVESTRKLMQAIAHLCKKTYPY